MTPAPAPSLFYLHGFASSGESTKGAYLGERLRAKGRTLACPDFNAPDFSALTMTRMLARLDEAMAAAAPPATLIGSSLGGALAILAASAFGPRIARLVQLAPAVMFGSPGPGGHHEWLPAGEIEEWRRLGRRPFFHYGEGAERMLNFAFYEDGFRYNSFDAPFSQPAIIFQGTRDASVDPAAVIAFATTRPNVALTLLDDDHQLTASLPRIWEGISTFLEVE